MIEDTFPEAQSTWIKHYLANDIKLLAEYTNQHIQRQETTAKLALVYKKHPFTGDANDEVTPVELYELFGHNQAMDTTTIKLFYPLCKKKITFLSSSLLILVLRLIDFQKI